MAKKKFYVVWDGIETGIFNLWEKCKSVRNNYLVSELQKHDHNLDADAMPVSNGQ